MRALITGATGFVGRHLRRRLIELGWETVAAGRAHDALDVPLELENSASVAAAVGAARPDVIFHLAGQTFVPAAYDDPTATYETNVIGTARLVEAARRAGAARIVFASSAQVYGRGNEAYGALKESAPIAPAEPYSASKAAAEQVCFAAFRAYGQPVVVARAFNHIGPGQDGRFVVASFARQLARIAKKVEPPRIEVGNLETERDFLDVRDVVEAYIALSERGTPGEAYNVCSGRPVKVRTLLRILIEAAGTPVEVREAADKLRHVDVPQFYGDNSKLRALGWEPRFALESSLRDALDAAMNDVVQPV
ncbi:MAG: GDP-mannose 4,6-dehydratase [Candidatus Eremiobacteraeota bacterium]|nr:GDP-mannose 4,6-dehydratase [Candidatus Eremiobacteraeota bacterium]